MLNFYSQNSKYLSNKQNKIINNIDSKRKINLVRTREDNLTVQVELDTGQEIYLHSKYRPKKEAEKYLQQYDLSNFQTIILIGFGFGYYAEEILQRIKDDQKLKIIITSPDIFKLALQNKDFSDVLKDNRVELVLTINPKKLVDKIQKILANETSSKLIYKRQFIRTIPKEFQFLHDILEKIWIDQKNNKQQREQIKKNINQNLKIMLNSLGIKDFRGLFNKQPIFVISAGPSLDKNIEQLKRVKDKGVIVAVDTAIDPLLTKDIELDFIVTIESNINGYNKIFKNHSDLEIPLLYSMGTHHKTIKNYSGLKIAALSQGDLSLNELDKKIDKGRVKTDGSVSSTAIDFAVQLGGDPIILVGQDLAFDKNRTHAANTFYDGETRDDAFLRPIPGVNQKEVYTDTAYYTYLRTIEKYIIEHDELNFIDATEGGAKIKGTKINKLETVIDKYCTNDIKKEEKIEKIVNEYNFNTNYDLTNLKRIINEK